MSTQAMCRVAMLPLSQCTLTAYRVLILAALIAHEDEQEISRAPLRRPWVAGLLGITPKAVQRAVRELVAAGLLSVDEPPRRVGGTEWHPTTYVVMPHGDRSE